MRRDILNAVAGKTQNGKAFLWLTYYVCEGENFQEKIGSLYFEMNLPLSKL